MPRRHLRTDQPAAMNRSLLEKTEGRAIAHANHVLKSLQLMGKTATAAAEARRKGLVERLMDAQQAVTRQRAAEKLAARCAVVSEERRALLGRAVSSASTLLSVAEPKLATPVVDDLMAELDPALLASRFMVTSKRITSAEGKVLAKLVQVVVGQLEAAEAERLPAQAALQQAILERASLIWTLKNAAREADLFIRLTAPRSSPAVKHLKTRRRKSVKAGEEQG